MAERAEEAYGSWRIERLHCLYLNLSQIDEPSELDKHRLQLAVSILAHKPFEERLRFYGSILMNMRNYAASDDFEHAIKSRNMAEEFRRHFLD